MPSTYPTTGFELDGVGGSGTLPPAKVEPNAPEALGWAGDITEAARLHDLHDARHSVQREHRANQVGLEVTKL